MSEPLVPPKEKKLRSLRKILWIIFSAVTITILLLGGLVKAALLIIQTSHITALAANEAGLIFLSLVAVALIKIAATGIICLVIYFIFKFRLEKDDDLFL